MRNSAYLQLAKSAAQCEKSGNLSEAANLWKQANVLAVLKANRDWTAHRANVCEIRLMRQDDEYACVKTGGAA